MFVLVLALIAPPTFAEDAGVAAGKVAPSPTASAAPATPAAPSAIPAGEFVYEYGRGSVIVGHPSGTKQSVEIRTVGENGHTCTVSGTALAGRMTLDGVPDPCRISLAHRDGTVTVEGSDVCRDSYCGARAHFTGDYRTPIPGCAPREIAAARTKYLALHASKRHAEAADVLAPVVDKCVSTLVFPDVYWIRNDLAVAQGKAGRKADCRATLEPLRPLTAITDKALREGNTPFDGEVMVAVARATRFNLKLCAPP